MTDVTETPVAPLVARLRETAEKLRILANQLAVCDCHDSRCIVAAAKKIGADELHAFEQAASAALVRSDTEVSDAESNPLTPREQYLVNRLRTEEAVAHEYEALETAQQGEGDRCTVPPEGWSCTRKAGHDGPCAAVPSDDPELDAMDAAHPAWWRGYDHGVDQTCRIINAILDGDPGPHYFGSARLTQLAARLAARRAAPTPERNHA